jgi:hypothetical protein
MKMKDGLNLSYTSKKLRFLSVLNLLLSVIIHRHQALDPSKRQPDPWSVTPYNHDFVKYTVQPSYVRSKEKRQVGKLATVDSVDSVESCFPWYHAFVR